MPAAEIRAEVDGSGDVGCSGSLGSEVGPGSAASGEEVE